MATTIDRTGITLTNDTGTPASPNGDGTLLSAADRTALLDAIDDLIGNNITFGGLLSAEGFGTHALSAGGTGGNILSVRNTSAGTGNYARIQVGQDGAADALHLTAYASTHATGPNFGILDCNLSSGLLIRTLAAAPIYLATNGVTRLTVSSAGVVTPEAGTLMHAGFLAYNSADDTSVTSGSTVDFDTEIYDEGGNFSSDTFTAPVTGRYLLAATVHISNTLGAQNNCGARIVVSNHTGGFFLGYTALVTGAQHSFSGSVVVDMDASDTATVQYYSDSGASTVKGDNAGLRLTWFCGRRIL